MTFFTEGPLGIKLAKPSLFGHQFDEREFFWVVTALLALTLVVVHCILRPHLGRAFEARRGSPVASDCMGVSVYRYQVYAFVISAGLAGLAGSLYVCFEQRHARLMPAPRRPAGHTVHSGAGTAPSRAPGRPPHRPWAGCPVSLGKAPGIRLSVTLRVANTRRPSGECASPSLAMV